SLNILVAACMSKDASIINPKRTTSIRPSDKDIAVPVKTGTKEAVKVCGRIIRHHTLLLIGCSSVCISTHPYLKYSSCSKFIISLGECTYCVNALKLAGS